VLAFALPVGHEVCDVGVHNRNHGLIVVAIADYSISR
jgi:hypothetical protein